jgi:hypothetical protein
MDKNCMNCANKEFRAIAKGLEIAYCTKNGCQVVAWEVCPYHKGGQ